MGGSAEAWIEARIGRWRAVERRTGVRVEQPRKGDGAALGRKERRFDDGAKADVIIGLAESSEELNLNKKPVADALGH